ncbi:HNH endonuclease signature motif containing protein [Mycoplasma sp. ATU-Cv-703]|uniref:HNH endonuclease n=1 Tax=Mycoplasma sp. ATU-Cv-703 TaxID=2498595 RepID=UPI000FDF438D
MNEIKPYLHIVNNEITNTDKHPMDGEKKKKVFVNLLLQDLESVENTINDISEEKENLFRIYYKDSYYNIFIEHPDGGGRDIHHNSTSKKVAIPFHVKAFKKLIENFERVLVINVYLPQTKNGEIDYLNRVYLIVDPKEIYKSKVVNNDKKNASSRWVTLEQILNVIESEGQLANDKKNVHLVHWKKIQSFFDSYLKRAYRKMVKEEWNNFVDKNIRKDDFEKSGRKIFRELLINTRGIRCEIIGCKVNIIELLIASHIKPVSAIKSDNSIEEKQKRKEISDPFNGFLLCPNHDALFDKLFITFDNEGKLVSSRIMKNHIEFFNLKKDQTLVKLSKEHIRYLKFHNRIFRQKHPRKFYSSKFWQKPKMKLESSDSIR